MPLPVELPDGETIELRCGRLATSSVARRSWRRVGELQHHLIDPRTGRPSDTPWRDVSVVAASGVAADVAAKSALLLGTAGPRWLDRRRLAGASSTTAERPPSPRPGARRSSRDLVPRPGERAPRVRAPLRLGRARARTRARGAHPLELAALRGRGAAPLPRDPDGGLRRAPGAALLLDRTVPFSLRQELLPFTSTYRPFGVSLGVVWRAIHYAALAIWPLVALHVLLVGTDRGEPWLLGFGLLGAGAVGAAAAVRLARTA